MAIKHFVALIKTEGASNEIVSALADIDEDALPELLTELGALDTLMRLSALNAISLSEQDWNFGLDVCRPFFKDLDENVRLAALRASVKLGGDPDFFGRRTMCELAATDPNFEIQQAAFDALTVFNTFAVRQFVHELLAHPKVLACIKNRAQKFLEGERFA